MTPTLTTDQGEGAMSELKPVPGFPMPPAYVIEAIEALRAQSEDSVFCNRVLGVEEFKALLRDLIVAYARAIPHPIGSGPEAIAHGEAVARAQVRVVEAYAFAARAATAETPAHER